LDASALAFAILPPLLAMLVEYRSPVSDDAIQFSIERDLGEFNVVDPDENNTGGAGAQTAASSELVKAAVISTKSAVEVSGLAPTIVSCVTSGFAVVNEMASPLWFAVAYVVAFITLGLFVIRMLAGHSFLEIGSRDYETCLRWKGVRVSRTRTQLVAWTIYGANGLLIVTAFLVFVLSPGKKEAVSSVASPPAASAPSHTPAASSANGSDAGENTPETK
jgi:hypothetical protein